MARSKTEIQNFLLDNFVGYTPQGLPLNKKEGSLPADLFGAIAIYVGGSKSKNIVGLEEKIEKIPYQAFLQTATEDYYIIQACEMLGVFRHSGEKAAGNLRLTGSSDTVVLAGAMFSNGEYNYILQHNVILDANGNGEGLIVAEYLGEQYNTQRDTIQEIVSALENVTNVTNKETLTNGTDIESIESLRKRGLYVKRNPPINGNVSFYKLLAENKFFNGNGDYILKGADGVKSARIFSATPKPGDVTVLIVNSIGEPANTELIATIQDVMNENRFLSANVVVESAEKKEINISAILNLADTVELDNVVESLRIKIRDHLRNVFENGKVKVSETTYDYLVSWSEIGNIIFDDPNITGYTDLKINGEAKNFVLKDNETPVLKNINFKG